ncbi:hypothetical protein RJ640_017269 [Escallonia rubra]|uniref:Alpha 1,4-glycosyltransferase domain-containing protein n=1 Tax=Escallonia rubra TaxID=112253 RepID=A0AA88RHR4_9ASTE|nr:hypothetical protein RJ640_017269 [Escallonia rubra]
MLRNLRARRRPRYGPQVCALIAALLLLLSVSLLYSRLSLPNHHHHRTPSLTSDTLLQSSDPDDLATTTTTSDDRIDEQDNEDAVQVDPTDDDEDEIDQSRVSGFYFDHTTNSIRRAFNKKSIDQWEDYVTFSEVSGSDEDRVKIAFGSDDAPVDESVKKKMAEVKGIEDALLLKVGSRVSPLREGWGVWFDTKSDFLRRDRMFKSNLELLNPLNNPLLQDPDGMGVTTLTRGDKLVQKGLFNEFKKVPFLAKKPLAVVESARDVDSSVNVEGTRNGGGDERKNEMKKVERRSLIDNSSNLSYGKSEVGVNNAKFSYRSYKTEGAARLDTGESNGKRMNLIDGDLGKLSGLKNVVASGEVKSEFSGQVYADGKRWGYFPGVHPRLSFSNFMDAFFRKGKCSMRVFMVWNSPPWMFTVRHQRGLESLLFHHRDACVVVLSESIELNFFNGFVKDGFKVAVAMPNLDELLKDTPTHIFASVWYEWKKTKFYSTHYSELVRLAALYKYGGIYLDSDIVVLKPLLSLNNTVGMDNELGGSHLSGAVMAFRKHRLISKDKISLTLLMKEISKFQQTSTSLKMQRLDEMKDKTCFTFLCSPFILECLAEFYSTYDDTRIRWNGADLLARVAKNFPSNEDLFNKQMELKLQPSFVFFPISRNNITSRHLGFPSDGEEDKLLKLFLEKIEGRWSRQASSFGLASRYFIAPATVTDIAQQDVLFKRILNQSLTFHLWNSITYALIPEPDSLAARLINHPCIHCSEVL